MTRMPEASGDLLLVTMSPIMGLHDALVTLDPYTARTGPRLVARAATADSERNLRSLETLAETGATHVLTGHGEPWHQGIEAAVRCAPAEGAA